MDFQRFNPGTSDLFVIASVARQSHTMESVTWRLPRHFVPRNDGVSCVTKGFLVPEVYILKWQAGFGVFQVRDDVLQVITFFPADADLVPLDAALDFCF